MKIDQLIYLSDIAQTHSITQTAQRYFLSPQALNASIKKLEMEFGTTFLDRSNQGAQLTEQGVQFLQKAQMMIDIYDAMKEECINLAPLPADALPKGRLQIQCHTHVLYPLMLETLERYTHKYPDVILDIYENEHLDIIQAIAENKADFGIIVINDSFYNNCPIQEKPSNESLLENLQRQNLYTDQFMICCNKLHPAAQFQSLTVADLAHMQISAFDQNPSIYARLIGKPNGIGRYYSNNMLFHSALLLRNLSAAVISAFEFRKIYFQHKELIAIPLEGGPKYTITLITNKTQPLSTAAQLFINMLEKYDFYGA